ncbi:MAG: alpha/beta fold hydrolase [Intrasporangiaceae bacterium]|nr:alpha/beta fold hydrolase [Intrasporangiaceae bacterium]
MSPHRPRRVLRAAVVAGLALLLSYAPLASAEPGPDPFGPATPPAAEETEAPGAGIEPLAQRIPTVAEPDGAGVELDTDLFLPPEGDGPHPALILAHGFGGSKTSLTAQAQEYAAAGYVVLAYTARGFGDSGGRIHLMDPALEGADVSTLVDVLAVRDDVVLDAAGDPRVGIAGGSYGGAAALMGSALDERIDAAVALITWHDLAQSLFAQNATDGDSPTTPAGLEPTDTPGVFKQLWGSRFFGTALAGGPSGGGGNPLCGRFEPALCEGLTQAAETGEPDPELLQTLRANSPAAVIEDRMPPTLLIQGMADSLFGLDQSDANARLIAATGTPLAIRWTDGGHDGVSTTAGADADATRQWLDTYLATDLSPTEAAAQPLPVDPFTYALPLARRQATARLERLDAYPGLDGREGVERVSLDFGGTESDVRLLNPPGGQPASITALPGLGLANGLGSLPTYPLAALPGSSGAFDTVLTPERHVVVGSPRVRLTVTSTGEEQVLFASLWQVQGATASQPRALVAPVRVAGAPGVPQEVTVTLPAATYVMEQGSRWRLLLTTTDSTYAGPRDARLDLVELTDATLELPVASGEPVIAEGEGGPDTETLLVGGALAALLLLAGGLALLRRAKASRHPQRDDLADVPLVVDRLVKTYADGHRAVDDVSWRAERGQVVGLLGPNGAGKTTTMRMMLGLIQPDSGAVYVLGHRITPGTDVLGQVGALVEGPGFLPHLTGRQNLQAYWRATGRPDEEAGFEEVLDVAALGGALDRPVRTYSHGMKQRLGIAQAMLGKPDVLFHRRPCRAVGRGGRRAPGARRGAGRRGHRRGRHRQGHDRGTWPAARRRRPGRARCRARRPRGRQPPPPRGGLPRGHRRSAGGRCRCLRLGPVPHRAAEAGASPMSPGTNLAIGRFVPPLIHSDGRTSRAVSRFLPGVVHSGFSRGRVTA